MTESSTQRFATIITLHKVVDGNYESHPISAKEFDDAEQQRAAPSRASTNIDGVAKH